MSLWTLCKCNVLSFHHISMQVIGVLPEVIVINKEVVFHEDRVQEPFISSLFRTMLSFVGIASQS